MTNKTGRLIARYRRMLRFAYLSVYWNVVLAVGKLLFGLVSASFFLCVNALYNLGMGAAKYLAVYAYKKYDCRPGERRYREMRRRQNDFYRLIGWLLIVTSALYIVYCVRMFLGAPSAEYGSVVAIGIAAFTFTEIYISLQGAIATRRDREPMMEAIKLTSLASSLISLVLTQTALLSFTDPGDNAFYNGLSGILFGAAAVAIGVYMIAHMERIVRGKTERALLARAAGALARTVPGSGIELIAFEDIEAHKPRLRCRCARFDARKFSRAAAELDRRFHIELVFAEPLRPLPAAERR